MEGWLQMREEGGGWHMRWFVLKDGQLSYYKKRDDKLKGAFSITEALVGNTCGIDGRKDFLFALQMPGRTLYLQGRNADEVGEWTTAINRFTSSGSGSSAPSPRKGVNEQPPTKPMGLVRTASQKEGIATLSRSQPTPSPLSIAVETKPLPPIPSPRTNDSPAQTGSTTIRRQMSAGDGDAADALQRAEMILQRIMTAAGHAGTSSGLSVTPPGSPRDKALLQRAKDIESAAKQCEAIVLRLLQTPASSTTPAPSSPSPPSSLSTSPHSPLSLSSSPAASALSQSTPSMRTPSASDADIRGSGGNAAPGDLAATRAELSALKERSLKAIKQLMDENAALKKKRDDVESSKVTKDENAFLKSRIDMVLRKMAVKDEQIKKLRDRLEELQPGSAAALLASVRDPSGPGSTGGGGSGSGAGTVPAVGSPSATSILTASASASASGASTPTTEVEKETAEWLGNVFKFLDDPKVARYSAIAKPGSQPTSPREN